MTYSRSALIVGAAPVGDGGHHYTRLIREADLLIAADAGLLLCLDSGRVPDVCVGDFDSTPADVLAGAERAGAQVRRFPSEKDESDLDLALGVARDLGAAAVRFTAAFSGRLDHTLAALGTVMTASDLDGVCDEPDWRGYALRLGGRSRLDMDLPAGTVVSLIAPTGAARVTADGFAYPLHDAVVQPLSSLGLSNIALARPQRVTVHSGGLLVIVNGSSAPVALQPRLVRADTL